MKGFSIEELLIYDPIRQSSKRKPIQIDIQEAKIIAYHPINVALEQKCNTVGMAQGVYNFCHRLLTGKQTTAGEQKARGWQTIAMDNCTLILSEVQQNIWIFVKLDHSHELKYYRLGQPEDNYYLEQSFSENNCKTFMESLYQNFKLFYGSIRGWVFKENFQELQNVLTNFVIRFQQIYRHDRSLDLISFFTKDIRLIPLDVNTTLKFSYFKNVMQSYNANIAHIVVFAHGILAFTSLGKNTTYLLSKYLFSSGQPYFFSQQFKNRVNMMADLSKTNIPHKFGTIYNTKLAGFQDTKQSYRISMPTKSQGIDLLGIEADHSAFQLFDIFIQEEQTPMKISFYNQNNMFFATFYRNRPQPNEIFFQNRFFHDNADKFILKINESIPSILKPNDPYKYLFHNCATYTGKSTIKQAKDWKNAGQYIRSTLQTLQKYPEATLATSTQYGYWIYGVHRFSRILILLIPMDFSLARLQDFTSKMTKDYFPKAYM